MVKAEKVQDAVYEKTIDGLLQLIPPHPGLPECRFNRDDHIPQQGGFYTWLRASRGGKGEHVGRPFPAKISLVEFRDGFVISEKNAQLFVMTAQVF